jgi:hypothetical protein
LAKELLMTAANPPKVHNVQASAKQLHRLGVKEFKPVLKKHYHGSRPDSVDVSIGVEKISVSPSGSKKRKVLEINVWSPSDK